MGYLRRGKWIREEKFVSGKVECVSKDESIGSTSMLRDFSVYYRGIKRELGGLYE